MLIETGRFTNKQFLSDCCIRVFYTPFRVYTTKQPAWDCPILFIRRRSRTEGEGWKQTLPSKPG